MDAKLLRRLGTIEITDAFLTPEGIHQIGHIFLKFFPLSVRHDITRGMFVITGCSPELPEVLEGDTPPIVEAQITQEFKNVYSAKLTSQRVNHFVEPKKGELNLFWQQGVTNERQ